MKRDGTDKIISEASATPSLGEGRGVYFKKYFLKLAQSGGTPCIFFPDKTKTLLGESIQRKETGRTILY